MTILLTGGCGYIGSHTAVAMIEEGHTVILADDFRNSSRSVPMRIGQITGVVPYVYDVDICDKGAMERVFLENDIDCVVHFAGYKSVAESVAGPLSYYRNNIDSALTVLELMVKYSCSCFVFSSSATVYGAAARVPYTEKEPINDAESPYGRSKIMIERIIEDAANAYGISSVMLRYFNPAGAHPSGLIGESPRGVPNNLMPYITRVALGELDVLHIYGDDYATPDGTGVRDYIHVMDLARGHLSAVEYTMSHEGSIAVNLGTGRGTSVLEMVHAFERATGIKIPYVISERRPGDLGEYFAESVRALGVLDWKAELTVEDMCRDAWRWQQHVAAAHCSDERLDVI